MIISRAPVRISFFGGGTDYPEYFLKEGGAVLASAIDKYSYVTASRFLSHLFDYSIRISYRKVELAADVNAIDHSVFRECLRFCGLEKDIELHNVADLPAFTGLGSSSAFTVSLLHALHAFQGKFLKPYDLARQAIAIERDVLKENVGCQDQVMAAFGGFNLVEFHTDEHFTVKRVPITPSRLFEFEKHLLLVFTGIKRKASDVVAHQLKRVNENLSALRSMREMVYQGFDILTGTEPLQEFGVLMNAAWLAKRSLDEGISNREIDALYLAGLDAGAWGGKLLGAGAGGFMLFFAPPEVHPRLEETFKDKQIMRVKLNAPGSEIIFSS